MPFGKSIAGFLALVMLFNQASLAFAFTGMKKVADIRDAGGTFVAWQASDLSGFSSTYVAPNGVALSIAATRDRITMGFGRKWLKAQRRQDGSLHVVTFDGIRTSSNDLSAAMLRQAGPALPPGDADDALGRAMATALSMEERAAYDAMLAFFLKHDEIASAGGVVGLSTRCILNLAAFYAVTAAAIVVCIESVGLLCAGAVAGAYQSLDAAIGACNAEQQ